MKATGIVRRIDDLGRVVIPKEIRRTLRIREGDPLEIFTDQNGAIVLKKYSPIGDLSTFAGQYAQGLAAASGSLVCVMDRDHIIAAAGNGKKNYDGDAIGAVALCSAETPDNVGEVQGKLAQAAAVFLAKQVEQ